MALSLHLIFGMVCLVTFVYQTQCQYFNSGPSNLTVYEGQEATLTCASAYATVCNSREYYFSWYRGVDTLVAGCSATSKFTIYAGQRQYRLTIRNAQPEDSGEYWCALVFRTPPQVKRSSKATFTVRPNPSCTFEPTKPTVGTKTNLTCALSSYDSSTLLTWYGSRPSFFNRIGFRRNAQPGVVYYIERMLTESDNMREFICVAGPDYNGPSCSFTPLQIPPTVSISPSHLTLLEHENASFTCDFRSTPQQISSRYEWRVIKHGITEVEVNQEVLQNLEGQFELENGGRTLQIINATLEAFHNAQIRCIAFYDGTDYTSDNESLLVVFPLTPMATDMSFTTNATERNSDENNAMNSAGSSIVFIVGGILGAIFFLIIIALLGCYLIKYKHNPTGADQTAVTRQQKSPIDERVITLTNRDEGGPTYDQIPVDQTGEQNRQITSDFTTQGEELYTFPDKTGPEIWRYVASSSSAIGEVGGTVCINNDESIYSEAGQQSGLVIYTIPEKGPRSPTIISDTEGIGPQQKNAEGLAYADLDLQRPSSATQAIIDNSADQSACTYANISTD